MVVTAKTESTSIKPHIVVLASPGMGHVIPLFQLAKRLVVHHSCHVTFLNITNSPPKPPPPKRSLFTPDLPLGPQVIDLPATDLSAVAAYTPVFTRLCINVQQSLLSLKSILMQLQRPHALIIDLFCTQAFDICRELSIPVYSFFTASTHLLAFSLLLPKLDIDIAGEFVDLPEPIRVPVCAAIRTLDLIVQVTDRKSDEYKWYLYHLGRITMAAGIFLNTWENLDPGSSFEK